MKRGRVAQVAERSPYKALAESSSLSPARGGTMKKHIVIEKCGECPFSEHIGTKEKPSRCFCCHEHRPDTLPRFDEMHPDCPLEDYEKAERDRLRRGVERILRGME